MKPVYVNNRVITEEWLDSTMYHRGLPEYMVKGMFLYLTKGILPGSFLQAVLENDLQGAAMNADQMNRECLTQWALFLYNDLPADCYGSPAQVQTWAKRQRES